MARRRKNKAEEQESVAFNLYEGLKFMLQDMQLIDEAVPREISRIPTVATLDEASAIIIARKDDLLRMAQTMCRDHMLWGNKLLADGWKPEHKGKFGQKASYRKWRYVG